ncbi:MAG: FIST C-terminal domain-containing protein [Sphingomonadaceae bacterium]|uniref:FIST C-terminal domain-containing protein n=1 Tax=Thermaurantiacus sp. TaxID=2820283 RepID=UPI00298EE0AA|nr:FIST C-terminal domain-containing protein [Thermaurantiacus sp.]MCS6986248.1 FIST C-terminal domain-containing protein [Sphingomonadaceae bacterium]MDW8415695.1 FIST C-terminal domain-containing protein [Thermaurantiacus sp.]
MHELNAVPAAEEYARLVGVHPRDLATEVFALNPLLVRAGGEYHVRSIQRALPDGSLAFYCAIDNGLVLTLGEDTDQLSELGDFFRTLEAELGPVDRVLAFNCVHNTVVARARQQEAALGTLFERHRVVGFSTFGEQFGGLHVNQTFTGLAFAGGGSGPRGRG